MSAYLLKNSRIWGQTSLVDIMVCGDKIVNIAPVIGCSDAEVIDMSGKTVLPGFFNAHVHLYGVNGPLSDELIRSFVIGGCTCVRDMGMTSEQSFDEYMKWVASRRGMEYPRIISSGKFICGDNTYGTNHPSGAKIGYVIDMTEESAKAAVDAMVDIGADQVKTGLDYGMDPDAPLDYLPENVFRAICARAKERGVRSSAHITKADNFVKAALWGLSESAHTPTDPLSEEDIRKVKLSGMCFNTTASIFDQVSKITGEDIMDNVLSNIGKLYRSGVPMSVGTDYMHEAAPEETAGIPVHELTLLAKAGLTVAEVIDAATVDTAKVLGLDKDLGSVEVGKIADIIAIDAPIDETFDALKSEHVVFVMHGGEIEKRDLNG